MLALINRLQGTAQCGLHSEHVEKVCGGKDATRLVGSLGAGNMKTVERIGGDAGHRLRLLLPVANHRQCDRILRARPLEIFGP